MPCYKSGGCGAYEMRSCRECPASKPEYLLRSKHPCDGCDHGWGTANENGVEVCNDTCKEFKDWSEQQAMAKLCGQCNKTDGMCYTSNPPKVKCTFPTAEYVEHIKNSDIVGIGNSENGWIADINNALFPSLKPGDHIDIDGACRRFGI